LPRLRQDHFQQSAELWPPMVFGCVQELVTVDRTATGEQQQPQRLASLPRSWQGKLITSERCTCAADRVESVVFATQPPLAPRVSAGLEHDLALTAQITSEAGAVMPSTFDRPDACTRRVILGDPKRLPVAAAVRRDRTLRHNRTRRRGNNRKRLLIAVSVDADHLIHLICKHPC
jgi:hypothetical protein